MGIAESFLSLGWIVGPLVGGYAAHIAGFAAPFVLTAALTFLTVPVLIILMPGGAHLYPALRLTFCSACSLQRHTF